MASVLSRIGTGVLAFGANRTSASINQERQQVEIGQQSIELNQQQIDAQQDEIKRRQETQGLISTVQAGGPDSQAAANRLFQINPEMADALFKSLGATSSAQREDASRRAAEIQATPFNQREAVILAQAEELRAQGRDPSDTESLIGQSEQDQNAVLTMTQAAALSTKERLGGGGASKLGQSVVTTDPEGNLSFATPVLGPGGEVVTQTTPIGGQIVSRSVGETRAQRQQREIETAGGQTTARAVSARDQNFIDVGQRQADGTAIIRRGIQLLKTIKTGTPEAIALAATNLLGITGADETELNANLGKAVLSQLRSTFGAQFTESEGKRLAGLEAAFGKSTAGNRRLLEQTLKAMERDARRGIDAARRNEDQFSIDEIEKALEFSLGPEVSTDVSDDDRLKELGF